MTRHGLFLLASMTAATASAQPAQDRPAAAVSPSGASEFDLARKKVADCEGERFVFAWGAGAKPTKVTLCSDKGASVDKIVAMLEDAANKLERTASIPEDRRVALVQQIRAKAKEVRARPVEAAAPPLVQVAPPAFGQAAPPRAEGSVSAPVEISALPPLPRPAKQAPVPMATRPLVAPPRLGFECITPGEFGAGGPCVTLSRDTVLIVESRDALPDPVALRFFRDGPTRAEVPLGAMRKGQARRMRIPGQVCSGVSTGEVAIRIVRAGQVVNSAGPYLLRC